MNLSPAHPEDESIPYPTRHSLAYRTCRHTVLLLALAALIWFTFGSSLQFGFVWDDHGLIVNNKQVRLPEGWYRSFIHNFWRIGENVEDPHRSFYRPLISFSYMTDYALWGLDPRGYHLTNLLAHTLFAVILYVVGLLLFRSPALAFIATALAAVHPSHVENVCWISGRTDIFCGIFFLLAFYYFVRWTEFRGFLYLAGTTLCYALSLLSKEMALTLPLVLVFYYGILERERCPWRSLAAALVPLVMVTAAYLAARGLILGQVMPTATMGALWQRVASIPVVFCRYLGLLVGAVRIDPHHSEILVRTPWSALPLLCAGLSLAYLLTLWLGHRHNQDLLVFLFAWIPLTLVPVFHLGSFGDVLYADRFLYIPSVGFAFGVIVLARKSAWWKPTAPLALKAAGCAIYLFFLAVLVAMARVAVPTWTSDYQLFARAAQTSPQSAYVQFNLGNALLRKGMQREALAVFQRAIQLRPDHARTWTNMGILWNEMDEPEIAVGCFRRAQALGDHSHVLYANLAQACRETGDLPNAIAAYNQAIAIHETATAHNNLGECLLASGFEQHAYEEFMTALQLDPSPAIYNNLALVLVQRGAFQEALKYLDLAFEHPGEPLSPELSLAIHYNYARAYGALGDPYSAMPHARAALNLIASGQTPPEDAVVRELERWAQPPDAPAD